MIGTIEAARARSTAHEGAVYLHMGRSYEVQALDLEARHALVQPFDGDWYTQPKQGDRRPRSSGCSTAARRSG